MSNVIPLPERKPVNKRVGMNVRIIMLMRDVSQPRLTAHLGLTQPSISRKMSGATPWTPDELEATAALLRVPVGRLFDELPGLDSNQEPIGSQSDNVVLVDFGRAS